MSPNVRTSISPSLLRRRPLRRINADKSIRYRAVGIVPVLRDLRGSDELCGDITNLPFPPLTGFTIPCGALRSTRYTRSSKSNAEKIATSPTTGPAVPPNSTARPVALYTPFRNFARSALTPASRSRASPHGLPPRRPHPRNAAAHRELARPQNISETPPGEPRSAPPPSLLTAHLKSMATSLPDGRGIEEYVRHRVHLFEPFPAPGVVAADLVLRVGFFAPICAAVRRDRRRPVETGILEPRRRPTRDLREPVPTLRPAARRAVQNWLTVRLIMFSGHECGKTAAEVRESRSRNSPPVRKARAGIGKR
jgi:hypothetical protein